MSDRIKVGVSGGIGSGKSYVCALIEQRGFPVYYADARAKWLMNTHPAIRQKLIDTFGEEVYEEEGRLNRPFLAKAIFGDESKRKMVNSIVHPEVYADFGQWLLEQASEMVFQESALMFDTGAYKAFDFTILVDAPIELRIQRLVERDNLSATDIAARLRSQGNAEDHRKLADFVIENGETENVEEQLETLLRKIQPVALR